MSKFFNYKNKNYCWCGIEKIKIKYSHPNCQKINLKSNEFFQFVACINERCDQIFVSQFALKNHLKNCLVKNKSNGEFCSNKLDKENIFISEVEKFKIYFENKNIFLFRDRLSINIKLLINKYKNYFYIFFFKNPSFVYNLTL